MTNTRTTIEEISHSRKVARWAVHECAVDLRHVAASITQDSVTESWEELLDRTVGFALMADNMLAHSVSVARAHGASWADIAAITGGTRQGAQQKHSR